VADVDAFAERIVAAWHAKRIGPTIIEPNELVIDSLSARNGAQKLAALFDEVAAR